MCSLDSQLLIGRQFRSKVGFCVSGGVDVIVVFQQVGGEAMA
jgi:hypothetical protein